MRKLARTWNTIHYEMIKTARLTEVAVIDLWRFCLWHRAFSSQQGEFNMTQTCMYVESDSVVTYDRIKQNLSSISGVFQTTIHPLSLHADWQPYRWCVCVLWLNRSCILHVLPHYLYMAAAEQAPRLDAALNIKSQTHACAPAWYIMKGQSRLNFESSLKLDLKMRGLDVA